MEHLQQLADGYAILVGAPQRLAKVDPIRISPSFTTMVDVAFHLQVFQDAAHAPLGDAECGRNHPSGQIALAIKQGQDRSMIADEPSSWPAMHRVTPWSGGA